MLWCVSTVPLEPRIPRAGPSPRPRPAPAGVSPAVNVWVTSTLTFSGNDTAFSRNDRLPSYPRPPIRPRTENSGTSVMKSCVTSTTGSPAGLYAATLNARMIAG